jgi:hypothetical protein
MGLKASGATTMVSSSIRSCFTVCPQLLKKGRGEWEREKFCVHTFVCKISWNKICKLFKVERRIEQWQTGVC